MKQDITPRNEKGELHGYWEYYHSNGKLNYKGNFINGIEHGYSEVYYSNGKLMYKGKYINGFAQGYFLEYWYNSYHKFFYKKGNRYYKNRNFIKFETF